MGDEHTSGKAKAVAELVALAKTELDAGRIAKGTRLLKEAIERAADLENLGAASDAQSAIQHSTIVSELRAIYGLGGIRRASAAARRS
ncbi:MAG: hypothetical protein JSR25_09840 [Proteobacteria bacterium]|nr:hypothetical protein [Pseudomonadota bacterium]